MDGEPRALHSLLSEQVAYYRARAAEYDDEDAPPYASARRTLVDEMAPRGDVLELACGTGQWTQELVRHARSVTAVDASVEMIDHNRRRLAGADVGYVEADIFRWEPNRVYDVVFFAFWLSHVPPQRFEEFWDLVAKCVGDNGRVLFVDEDDRSQLDESIELAGSPGARRTLRDGREFEIVKVFWRPEDLEERLRGLGWDIDVRRFSDILMVGSGAPARDEP